MRFYAKFFIWQSIKSAVLKWHVFLNFLFQNISNQLHGNPAPNFQKGFFLILKKQNQEMGKNANSVVIGTYHYQLIQKNKFDEQKYNGGHMLPIKSSGCSESTSNILVLVKRFTRLSFCMHPSCRPLDIIYNHNCSLFPSLRSRYRIQGSTGHYLLLAVEVKTRQ